MFQVGFGEAAVIVGVALLVLGPERLPHYAAEAGKALRKLRRMAQNATDDLRSELGPEFAEMDIADLHPRRFVRKHLMDDDDNDVMSESPLRERRISPRALEPGERPPYDADAT